MNAISSLKSIQTIPFHRLLQKQNIEIAAKACMVGLVLAALAVIGLVVAEGISSTLAVQSTQKKLSTDIGNLVATIKQKKAAPPTERNYSLIAQRNVFGPLTLPAPTPAPNSGAPRAASGTPFGLVGVFITDGESPYAIIEDQKKKQQDAFVIDESVFGEATLKKILPDRVVLDRSGQEEILLLDDIGSGASDGGGAPGAVSSGEGDQFVVDEAELDRSLENLPLLLTQARAVPYFSDGKAVGLRLFAIKSGSLFEKIGLRNGDILKAINGNSLGDLSQAMQLFEKLKSERSISVSLERNREEKEFRYTIR